MSTNISTLILTYNEEIHIRRCIENAQRFSDEIFLVDSYSTDKTVAIAEEMGAKVFQNKWENNHAKQFNWGLSNLPIETVWIFRLDADEYLSDALIEELKTKMPSLEGDVSGVIMPRKMVFQGKMINRGMIKMNMLRLFKKGIGTCENRWMDEHIILSKGVSQHFENYFVDENLNTLGWWIDKHNGYSIREAVDLLNLQYNFIPVSDTQSIQLTAEAKAKREKKLKYAKMPLFWRSFLYFIYRYFVKFGFLEGKPGFLWHFFQGWWYRSLVDAKIYEIKRHCGEEPQKMKTFIERRYGLKL